MRKKFAFEFLVGAITTSSVAIWGEVGMVGFALLAVLPFFEKKKLDEREYQLFYRIGNISAGALLLYSILIFYLSDATINGHLVGKLWLFWLIPGFLILHGGIGLIFFMKEDL